MFLNPFSWDYQMWRCFFVLAALWNFMGVFGIIWPRQSFASLVGKQITDQITLILYRQIWLSVLIFGIGYLIIAYDPKENLGLILLGIIGKVAAAGGFLILYKQGIFKKLAVLAAAGDLLYSLFFILYLMGGTKIAIYS